MTYLLYLFGFLPSIIWLAFYLAKDKHPESNKMVLKIFVFGMLSGVVAIFLEKGFETVMTSIKAIILLPASLIAGFSIFVGGALIEEFVKYGAVRVGVFGNPELDEPVDFMIYMIIAGLGFAALENVLLLMNEYHALLASIPIVRTAAVRFVSATFLHALCSGLLGYFLALSFLRLQLKRLYFYSGLVLASLLHGMYNYAIMEMRNSAQFLVPIAILIGTAVFLSFGFKKLKRSQAKCKI